ncbi:MAG TPA: DUF805 domain-containing protein [Acidobacteriaceae bacterium]|nr:DUF805 domain-containing protein [Acidobacteriaceae bacterium]
MDWYLMVWQKYAQFSGRSRRREYWMFTLINSVACAVLYGAAMVALLNGSNGSMFLLFLLLGAYGLAALIPSLAVSVRRLHDTNKTGWWLLLCLVPFGGLIIIVFQCLDSDPGDNQYGPNPKMTVAQAAIG